MFGVNCFKLSVIKEHNIRFDTLIYFNEDRLFITEYLSHISSEIAYSTQGVYDYIKRSSGAMGSLETGYNKRFATDFDASIKMKNIIFATTNNPNLRNCAINCIVSSYTRNHMLMVAFDAYDKDIHNHMLKGMLKSGAYFYYIKQVIRDLLLLIFPKFVVYYRNK